MKELLDALRKLAPEVADQIDAELNKTFDKANQARTTVKGVVTEMLKEPGMTPLSVVFGLMANTVVITYAETRLDRAKARDKLGDLIDLLLEEVDENARKNGTHQRMEEYYRLKDAGLSKQASDLIDKLNAQRRGASDA